MIQVIASLTVNPDAPEAVQTYFKTALPLIESVGAKVAQQIEVGEPLIGETPSKILMLVEYPSRAAVMQVFDSVAYQALVPVREEAFLHYHVSMVSRNYLEADDDGGWS